MGELAGGAYFWAMHSCEYAKVLKAEQRQTKQLCIRNIAFIKDGEVLKHNSPSLHLADCVSITFKRQKNDRKANIFTQWRTADKLLCPVKIWALLVRRVLSYKGTNQNSPGGCGKPEHKKRYKHLFFRQVFWLFFLTDLMCVNLTLAQTFFV
jgi:hypothetical protein